MLPLMQVVGLLFGLIYLNQDYDQQGVQNIDGALFLMQTQMSIGNVMTVINVSFTFLPFDMCYESFT